MRKEVDSSKKDIESMRTFLVALLVFGFCVSSLSTSIAQTPVDPSRYAPCQTTLACSAGPGGGRSYGPGGGLSYGPGGGLSYGPGGGLSYGPGGGLSYGPGGGLSMDNSYKGPWSPCLTGVLGVEWNRQNNCP